MGCSSSQGYQVKVEPAPASVPGLGFRWQVMSVCCNHKPIVSPDWSTVLFREKSKESTIKAIDMSTGQQRWSFTKVSCHEEYEPLITPDGQAVLVRDYDKNSVIKAIEMNTGHQRWSFAKVSTYFAPLLTPDGQAVLVRDYDKNSMVQAVDVNTGQLRWTVSKVTEHCSVTLLFGGQPYYTPVLSSSTVLLRNYDRNNCLMAIGLSTGKQNWMTEVNVRISDDDSYSRSPYHYEPVISPDGKIVLVMHPVPMHPISFTDYKMKAIDVNTGQELWSVNKVSAHLEDAPRISLEGSTVLLRDGSKNSILKAIDMKSGEMRFAIQAYSSYMVSSSTHFLIRDVHLHTSFKALDWNSGQEVWSMSDVGFLWSESGGVSKEDIFRTVSPDNSTVLFRSYSDASMIRVVDMRTGQPRRSSGGSGGEIRIPKVSEDFDIAPLFTPDGQTVLVRDYDEESTIRAIDISKGERWSVIGVSKHPEYEPVISPDGSTVLLRDYNNNSVIKAIDMSTGLQRWTLPGVARVKNDEAWDILQPVMSPDWSRVLIRNGSETIIRAFDMRMDQPHGASE